MASKYEPPRLGQVVGTNLERIRNIESWSQDDVAARGWRVGLPWTRSTVAAVEGGRRAIELGEVVLLALTLNRTVTELLAGTGVARLGDGSDISLSDIRQIVTRDARRAQKAVVDVKHRIYATRNQAYDRVMLSAGGEAEQKAARKLGVTPQVIAEAAYTLWRRSLTEERNVRVEAKAADPDTARKSQARRGHITRVLVREIESLLDDSDIAGPRKKV